MFVYVFKLIFLKENVCKRLRETLCQINVKIIYGFSLQFPILIFFRLSGELSVQGIEAVIKLPILSSCFLAFSLSLSLSNYLSISNSIYLSLSLSISLCIYLYLCISLYLWLSISLPFFISTSPQTCLSLSLPLSFSVCLYLCLSLYLSFSLSPFSLKILRSCVQ